MLWGMPADTWNPQQYERFKAERTRPFDDLLALVAPVPTGRVIDLGCGTGELTTRLHEHAKARSTLGIDTSAAMLERATPADGLSFEQADLMTFEDAKGFDLVFANASLQWASDPGAAVEKAWSLVAPGGQLAVQVPANFGHPSHTIADEVGLEFGAEPLNREEGVLTPGEYATLLHRLGAGAQHVRLQVYGNAMPATSEVVEWVRGTLLTRYERVLGDRFEPFLDVYRQRLYDALGDPSGSAPYFYAFERILFWASRPVTR